MKYRAKRMGGFLTLLAVLATMLTACSRSDETYEMVEIDQPEETMEMPAVIPPVYTSAEEWGSTPEYISDERRHTPTWITVHHSGVTWTQGSDPATKLRNLQSWGQRDKDWPDVPYHWFIAPDGGVFEGRSMEYEPETNTSYDTMGHINVHVWGNFEEQRVSPQQLVNTVHVIAWLCEELDIDPSMIGGHVDRAPGETSCPGRDLYRYISDGTLEKWVRAEIAGEEYTVQYRNAMPDGPTEMIPLD